VYERVEVYRDIENNFLVVDTLSAELIVIYAYDERVINGETYILLGRRDTWRQDTEGRIWRYNTDSQQDTLLYDLWQIPPGTGPFIGDIETTDLYQGVWFSDQCDLARRGPYQPSEENLLGLEIDIVLPIYSAIPSFYYFDIHLPRYSGFFTYTPDIGLIEFSSTLPLPEQGVQREETWKLLNHQKLILGIVGDFDNDQDADFDDFFLLVDHFGTTAGDPNWRAEYDMDGDRYVDIDDFYIFEDFFGRVIGRI